MTVKPIEYFHTGDRSFGVYQNKVKGALTGSLSGTPVSGNEVQVSLSSASEVEVAHGLGRAWRGYQIIKSDTNVATPAYTASSDETKFIRFQPASADANVVMLVW